VGPARRNSRPKAASAWRQLDYFFAASAGLVTNSLALKKQPGLHATELQEGAPTAGERECLRKTPRRG
jgi:hypothetical protein